jgi:hypothetical protein
VWLAASLLLLSGAVSHLLGTVGRLVCNTGEERDRGILDLCPHVR